MADEPIEAADDGELRAAEPIDASAAPEPSEPAGAEPSLDATPSSDEDDAASSAQPDHASSSSEDRDAPVSAAPVDASLDDDAPPDDEEPRPDFGNMRGVELTAEELDAIREATRASTTPGAVLIVSRPEDREQWSIDLDGAGFELAFVADPHQLLIALRDRDVESVIVDADACASGGLPALAVLRSRGERLAQRIVVASRPTRTHVVSCLAAGATGYLARPFPIEQLLEQLRG